MDSSYGRLLAGGVANPRRRAVAGVTVVALAIGLSALWIGLRVGGGTSARAVDDCATALAAGVATGCCWRAALRQLGQMWLFWSLLAAACLCWTAAELIWAAYDLVLDVPVPVPSWADLGYLSAIPLAIAALLCHPAMHRAGRRQVRLLFDGLIVATALAVLSWTLVAGPLWHSTDLSTAGGLVALAYPFGDVVIAFFIVLALRRMTGTDYTLWCLFAGLLTMAVTDSLYSYQATTNSYVSGSLADVGWIAAYLVIALAAFTSSPRSVAPRSGAPEAPTFMSFLAPLVPALLALGVTGIQLQPGHHLGNASRVMAFALVALVLARQSLLALEVAALGDGPEVKWSKALLRTAFGPKTKTRRPPYGHDHG
jgi:hypothetical protein